MNTRHSPFGVPRKKLVSRLYKSLTALLIVLALAFSGMYVLTNASLQQQADQQTKMNELLNVVNDAQEHWLQWLLIDDSEIYEAENVIKPIASDLRQTLLRGYRLIENHNQDANGVPDIDVTETMLFLESLLTEDNDLPLTSQERQAAYQAMTQLDVMNNELLRVKVAFDYDREVFSEKLIGYHLALFLFFALVAIFIVVRFARQLNSGFSALHHVVDHHKHRRSANHLPRQVSDEFTDLIHLVDNELSSRQFDLDQQEEKMVLIEGALSHVEAAFFVTNHDGDMVYMSEGARRLWFKDTTVFESMFGIDSGLDNPMGERIADSVLFSDQSVTLSLTDGLHKLTVCAVDSDGLGVSENLQRLISVQPKSDEVEFDVLHHSLMLLEKDVWNMPIRVSRQGSPYAGFAKSLEAVRHKVLALFDSINGAYGLDDTPQKLTKLQQMTSYINGQLADKKDLIQHDEALAEEFSAAISVELADIAVISEQVRDSLILGFELVLQRLALVEKDLSSDVFLLTDVDRCLNEVRAGVLSSLAAAEGEGENIRRRFAVDLEHDISKVQDQVEGMKLLAASTLELLQSDRSVGVARLNRANAAITEMLERMTTLRDKIALQEGKEVEVSPPSFNSDE